MCLSVFTNTRAHTGPQSVHESLFSKYPVCGGQEINVKHASSDLLLEGIRSIPPVPALSSPDLLQCSVAVRSGGA